RDRDHAFQVSEGRDVEQVSGLQARGHQYLTIEVSIAMAANALDRRLGGVRRSIARVMNLGSSQTMAAGRKMFW
ncbi:hypothetical protein, partial [Bradyrhizobium sp.]|uniref:hypothetical protein n=1 Tax=Bradyrhizobium sp. TaxID=376 RepID=UPI003C77A5EB